MRTVHEELWTWKAIYSCSGKKKIVKTITVLFLRLISKENNMRAFQEEVLSWDSFSFKTVWNYTISLSFSSFCIWEAPIRLYFNKIMLYLQNKIIYLL